MPLNDEKIIKYAEAKLEGGEALMLLEEIEETKEKLEETNEKISLLTEEVKKKEAEEITFEINPEDIRGPRGKPGRSIKGDPGYTPVKGKDYFTSKEIEEFKKEITPIKGIHYNDGHDGVSVKDEPGKKGDTGPMPGHEWKDTWLRFQKPDGEWGKWVNLQGKEGRVLIGNLFGGGGSTPIQIRKDGQLITTNANSINFSGFEVTNQDGNITVTAASTGVDESLAIAYAIAL